MTNNHQFDFDFADIGTQYTRNKKAFWNKAEWTKSVYDAAFEKATIELEKLTGVEYDYFSFAVPAWREQSEYTFVNCKLNETKPYSLWTPKISYSRTDVEIFLAYCERNIHVKKSGRLIKIQSNAKVKKAAIYIEQIGTILVSLFASPQADYKLDYSPMKSSFFNDSYLDEMESLYVPFRTWGGVYAAQTIGESNEKAPSVKTFTTNGREFVNFGGLSSQCWHDCHAYSICPIENWNGETFTYRELISAYNDGSVQRGDARGLMVKVRGHLCVFEKEFFVYDNKVTTEDRTLVANEDLDEEENSGLDFEKADDELAEEY